MDIEFQHKDNFDAAADIRIRVFIDEQGFSYDIEEFDYDPRVIHVTAHERETGEAIGVARVFPAELEPKYAEALDASEGAWIIGRIAVLPEKRHLHLGSALIAEGERIAREHGAAEMHLHAQCRVQLFYNRNGYVGYGLIEDEEGVDHQWMRKSLDSSPAA